MTVGTAIVIVGAMFFVLAAAYLAFLFSMMRRGWRMIEREDEIDKRTLEDFRTGSGHRFKP